MARRHLFSFHIMLKWRGQTTYEWIINRRSRKSGGTVAPPPAEAEDKAGTGNPHYGRPVGLDLTARYLYHEGKQQTATACFGLIV